MEQQKTSWFRRFVARPGIAELIALLGGILYLVLAYRNALIRATFLDEGLYLYKGWQFVSGKYQLFADYGPWTNQMPLSYLIPGFIQVLFGAGLRTGRYFAIFLSLLMLLALWLVTRRLAGRWWAAGVVWVIALNIASIKVYTLAISEGLVACMFAWVLFFILGDNRPTWQIISGSFLATAILLVRINLAPVAALVVLFIFWQHGARKGWIALLTAGLVFVISHALFWPGILKLWAAWLPSSLTPFLNTWRISNIADKWVTSAALPDLFERILYFFLSFRLHLLSLGGALVVWLLWPGSSKNWKTLSQYRTAVFLSVTLLLLLVMHMVAAFSLGFCISCVLLYITFFDFLGLLLLAQSFSALKRTLPTWRAVLAMVVFLGMGLGIVFSEYGEITRPYLQAVSRWIDWDLEDLFLWPILQKYGLSDYNIYQIRASFFVGSLVLVFIFFSAFFVTVIVDRYKPKWLGFSFVLLILCMIVGFIFSSSKYFSGGNDFFYCGGDMLQSYEKSGQVLQALVPKGSKVFWVGRIPAVLLYLPDIELFPPQLNHFHNLRTGDDDQELVRFGLWSKSLGRQWLAESDVALVEEQWLDGWVEDAIAASGFQEIKPPYRVEPCRKSSKIHVYVKNTP